MSLIAPRFKLAEYQRSIWSAVVEHGFDPKGLLEPKFWAHIANQVKPGDRIEVQIDSREWFAELYVLEVGSTFVRVALMNMCALGEVTRSGPIIDADFSIEFKGAVRQWCVIRKSDKAAIYEKLPSKDAAVAKLTAHTKPAVAA